MSRVISTLNGVTPITTLLITLLTKSPASRNGSRSENEFRAEDLAAEGLGV